MAGTSFDRDIARKPVSPGIYDVHISESWNVVVGPNGGYIAAIMLSAIQDECGGTPARTVTWHFLTPCKPGSARVEVQVEKRGRSLTTCTARLRQDSRIICLALATLGPVREGIDIAFDDHPVPRLSPPDEVEEDKRMGPGHSLYVPFRDHYDQRLAIGPVPPGICGDGRVGGWTRFRDPRPFDDPAVAAIADSWYPGLLVRELPVRMHAPTVEYTVHFVGSASPPPTGPDDFLMVEFVTSQAQDGYLLEDGWIRRADGGLIARSRQMAVMVKWT